ncbi:TPA: hypothetical protein JG871_003939 [Enterobacter hormaechei subsp. xiangfangensis]|nr:hypothetical protein [Enterobacter hormaechei subsp. xiangfangensis]
MKLKTLIATALLGAVVSAPALAHDYVAEVNQHRQTLETQQQHIADIACKEGKMDLCAVSSSMRVAAKLLATLPADASNHELLERLELVDDVFIPATDEYALKGQFEGLNNVETNEANAALTEAIHASGHLMKIMASIMKSEGK